MVGNQVSIETVEGSVNFLPPLGHDVDSIINKIISEISTANVKFNFLDRTFPSSVAKKIAHNNLKNKRYILLQYKEYSSFIERAYVNIDGLIVNGKQKTLMILNEMYFKSLSKLDIDPYEPNINSVRENADIILDDVICCLREFVYNSSNVPNLKENIEIGLNVIVAHSFVECVVMENPNASY